MIFSWVGIAKVSRSMSLQIKTRQYVEAAKIMGQKDSKIIFKHIIPQMMPYVFASIANYLTSIDKNPWYDNSTWGREVTPPNNIHAIYDSFKQSNPKGCGAVKSRSVAKSLIEWQSIGFRTINGNDLPKREDLEARLVAPDGTNGRMFLVYSNYKNILYYNCSSYYAIAIGLLSDAIKN